ncbi:MAG: prolyl oligopeptidase family serine peptidase [Verrucomicrobiota bacterium]
MRDTVVVLLAMGYCLAGTVMARTWTSTDGRTIEAEFVSATEEEVTIRRESDGRTFAIKLDTLSEGDRKEVAERLAAEGRPAAIEAGPYLELLDEEWASFVYEDELPVRLYGPKRTKATDLLPLVIYLHGVGQKGEDNERQLGGDVRKFADEENFGERPCIVVVPQCAEDSNWKGESGQQLIKLVKEMLELAPVDASRVYLTGYSMGGYGTWALLAQEPELFAAGIPVAGGANPNQAEALKDIPIWAFHGAKDPTVKVEQSRGIVEALKAIDGKIKYTEYPDKDHGISWDVFGDGEMHEWLFLQKRE